jgi:hypothetical protein
MKTINDQQLTKYAIPDGEGFTALPIAFKYVIARRALARRGNLMSVCNAEIASLPAKRVSRNDNIQTR